MEIVVVLVISVVGGVVGSFIIAALMRLKLGEGKRMGINLSGDNVCPKCGVALPMVRRPKNVRQVMWGGWTCENCGVELDKWLKPIG